MPACIAASEDDICAWVNDLRNWRSKTSACGPGCLWGWAPDCPIAELRRSSTSRLAAFGKYWKPPESAMNGRSSGAHPPAATCAQRACALSSSAVRIQPVAAGWIGTGTGRQGFLTISGWWSPACFFACLAAFFSFAVRKGCFLRSLLDRCSWVDISVRSCIAG
mgnify:CR=1 FL=1